MPENERLEFMLRRWPMSENRPTPVSYFEKNRGRLEKDPVYWRELYDLSTERGMELKAEVERLKARVAELSEWKRQANGMMIDVHSLAIENNIYWDDKGGMLQDVINTAIDWNLQQPPSVTEGEG